MLFFSDDRRAAKATRLNKSCTRKHLRVETLEERRLLAVVINEIHFNSEDNTIAEEFVELHNTAATAVDLSGWSFSDGVSFTFDPGSQIPAGGYVVVADDPATLLSQFGIVAIGQYDGGLSNSGERIAISDSQGMLIDEVEYATSFPWPIASDGEGPSMELVNPGLDNNLGSNWRPSYTEPLFVTPEGDIPPTSSPSGLVHRWSFSGNLEDSVGGADGVLVDPTGSASYSFGRLDVTSANFGQTSDQTPFTTGAYVDLPNGIISALGEDATFEWWGTASRSRTWAEIFSFGTSNGGEDQSPGASGESYITLIPEAGNGDLRLTHRRGDTGLESQVDWTQSADLNTQYHFVVVWDGVANTQRLYIDGQSIGSGPTLIDLEDLNDNNNWLGRSQFNDPLFDGFHNEFRIYDRALSGAEVASSFVLGPDAAFAGPAINAFSAESTEITAGQTLELTWDVDGEDTLSLAPDIGDVTGLSSLIVSPTSTTTYTLSATDANATTTRSITVTVNQPRATPGAVNASRVANAAPAIERVEATGGETSLGTGVVTAEVSDPDGVSSVELQYQVVLAGDYIPARLPVPHGELLANPDLLPTANPDYFGLANWISVMMVDDGTGADEAAGDGLYTATIPTQDHRTLVRYRVEVADTLGASALAPYSDDASLNFAYFVYDGVPEYRDNNNQVLADADELDSLPVYHLISRAEDIEEANAWAPEGQIPQGTEARSVYNWGGTIVYNGVVYDNIKFRPRGANGRYFGEGKRSMRYRFNDGYWLEPLDQNGDPYPEPWRTLTTGKGFDNHSTLTYGLNEALTMQLSNLMGLPALDTHWFQFRVIDDAAEAPDQWNGDFWGINFALEDYDKRFLDSHGLEEGNLYKLINQSGDGVRQRDYQAPNAVTDGSDHDYVEYVMGRASDDIEHRVNLDKYYIFHALSEAVRHYDYWATANKNMAYYFEPDYAPENDFHGSLWLLLWDTDASWGPTWNEGHDLVYDSLFNNFDSLYAENLIRPAYFNTLRELRDLIWQPDQIEGMLTELGSSLLPLEAADRARWQGAPSSSGSYDGLSGQGTVSIDALMDDMLDFAFQGGDWPSGGSGPGGFVQNGGRAAYLDDVLAASGEDAFIPFTPSITYSGDPGMAANELSFQTTAFSDPQGTNTFGAVQWRVSEVTPVSAGADETVKFLDEWTASWDSGPLTTFDATIDPPEFAVTVGATHRARVRMQDETGRWSHWSEPIEFVATAPTQVSTLAITELHYNPDNPGLVDDNDQEFFEILNTGETALNLAGVQVVDFASEPYVFGPGQTLQPGEYLVVARTPEVFTSIYGSGVNLAPEGYGGANLSNGGETITLLSASGQVIQSFTYDDRDPWPEASDGDGPSLEIIDPLGDPSDPANWRASLYATGSPGFGGLPIQGDYDLSGTVDEDDRSIWRSAYGSVVASVGTGADGNRDGVVDAADYTVWRDHLGDSLDWFDGVAVTFSASVQPPPLAIASTDALAPTQQPVARNLGVDTARQSAFAMLWRDAFDRDTSSRPRLIPFSQTSEALSNRASLLEVASIGDQQLIYNTWLYDSDHDDVSQSPTNRSESDSSLSESFHHRWGQNDVFAIGWS